jgi:hypothetical protein
MKLFITMMFAFSISSSAFSEDSLRGRRYASCDTPNAPFEIEYNVEYLPGQQEFEAEIFREKSKNACKGRQLFALVRVWKYEIYKNELVTTLERVKVLLIDSRLVESFNRQGICGLKNWRIDEMVSCDGKFIFDFEPSIGDRTSHKFKQFQNKLIINDGDDEAYELIQVSSEL